MKTITLAFTGASGLPYGLRTLECLLAAGCKVRLVYTQVAQIVAKQELDLTWPSRAADLAELLRAQYGVSDAEQLQVYGQSEWFAPMASGSNPGDGMIVVPCTMGALSAIANGASDNLLERAADVMIKERKTLILVPRETPFSAIHLEHMLKLSRLGVVILPPNPGFYHHPKTIEDLVDFVVARILDQVNVPHQLMQRWGE
ncbi:MULTISPECIES: flavin prenyltransferase UbiX [Deefgea]|uniref:Flavin prenyltransferase UbiX n=1 Tax=Deefgea chitinilytica TaxID=570276 RepID=A0ABS2C7C3_9NEIS|nr:MULTISPECIES: flavin prenyltransferase UbiX [Deefgea]MBM5570062.1 UbiX family flavin prenyltransferase [Deefgea chitinilytica]MBM9887291.1 UbiX family flavin prenyltransferase [Deefgea sp. CFH1-16]